MIPVSRLENRSAIHLCEHWEHFVFHTWEVTFYLVVGPDLVRVWHHPPGGVCFASSMRIAFLLLRPGRVADRTRSVYKIDLHFVVDTRK